MKIKVGSRDSKLAVIQAQMLIKYITDNTPHEVELITMKTTGDKILDRPLDKIGGKGLFVKELDQALKDGVVDLTVHSYKDMPAEIDQKLPIIAASLREDPRDALIFPEGQNCISFDKPIGCSSARRIAQLKEIFPGCSIEGIRGNVPTRLAKLDSGMYSAIVLASAGLKRLGLQNRINRYFSVDEMIPAACQGIIAVQSRDDFDRRIISGFNDADAWDASIAERAFTAALNGGCSAPVACYCEIDGENISLCGMIEDQSGEVRKRNISGKRDQANDLGYQLARLMIE